MRGVLDVKLSWICLPLLLLGCKEKSQQTWWRDASFHHDRNACDDPPPPAYTGESDQCGPRAAAWIRASVAEWKSKQDELHDAGCGDAWVQNPDGTCTSAFGCTPPDDAWVRNLDGTTCRLVR